MTPDPNGIFPSRMADDEQHRYTDGFDPAAMLASAKEPSASGGAMRGWTPPSVEALQLALPQYDFIALAGRGGMGAVYKAWQKSLDRFVAVKILPAEAALDDPGFSGRFKREARALARLSHPNIVTVYDAGETGDGLLYFVMDYIEGTDVHRMGTERGKIPPEEALSIVSHVCDALAYAHGRGVIHRDIKPSNVMLDRDGSVKVADFGLAKLDNTGESLLTASDQMMGSPDYLAPEAQGGLAQIDQRADIFAVGVMLYQMLTSRLPRGRFDPPSRIVPGLDKRLDRIIDRALQADPALRFSSARELRDAIEPPLALAKQKACTPARVFRASSLIVPLLVAGLATGAFLVVKRHSAAGLRKAESVGLAAAGTPGTPAAATKDAPFVNSLGMRFVPVPITGGPTGGQRVLFSVWETRVQDYEVFVRETKRERPKPVFEQGLTHPAMGVGWEDAQAFCVWLTEREHKDGRLASNERYRLPSDHEWSCAVGIGDREAAARLPNEKSGKFPDVFPWGRAWPPPATSGNFAGEELQPALTAGKYSYIAGGVLAGYRDGHVHTAPAASFPANSLGLHDLSGNVWEWCEDWYDASGKERVLRGGSWDNNTPIHLRSSQRGRLTPAYRYFTSFGFRCVLGEVSGSASVPEP
jgi:hypothetical protein